MCQPSVSQPSPTMCHQFISTKHYCPTGEPGESPAASVGPLGALTLAAAPPTSVASAPAVAVYGSAPDGFPDEATPASAPATVVGAFDQLAPSTQESLTLGSAAFIAEATDHGATSAEATNHAATSAEATDHGATSASVLTEASAAGSSDASWRLLLPTPADGYQAKAANSQQMY